MESDHDLVPDSYQPHDGDRTVAFGRWVVDCGMVINRGSRVAHRNTSALLVATGRHTGAALRAKCSEEQTCSSLMGRPYLVSQTFGDGAFIRHLEHEIESWDALRPPDRSSAGSSTTKATPICRTAASAWI